MKKIQMLFTVAMLCLSMVAFARPTQDAAQDTQNAQGEHRGQGRGHGAAMSPEAQLDHMSQMLNLSDDQKSKIKPIVEDQSKQMEQLKQDSSLSQEDRRAKFQQIHENTMSQIRPILNADQQKKLDAMKNGRGDHGHGQDHNPSSNPQ